MKKILLLVLLFSFGMTGCFEKKITDAVATPIFLDSDQVMFKKIYGLLYAGNQEFNWSSTINSSTLEVNGTCIETIIDDKGTSSTGDDEIVYSVGDNIKISITKTTDGKYYFTRVERHGGSTSYLEDDYIDADGTLDWGYQRTFTNISDIYDDEMRYFGFTGMSKIYDQSGTAYVNGSYITTALMYCQFDGGKIYFIQEASQTMGRVVKTEFSGESTVYFDENGNKVN